MKAPLAQRRVTGARGKSRRPRLPAARAPLRRPLALLYRQSEKASAAKAAAIRPADGPPVPLAPRLQIALHLWLTLNEQRGPLPVAAASGGAACVIEAATAPRGEWESSISGPLSYAAKLRPPGTAYRAAAEANAQGNENRASRHERFIRAWPGRRNVMLSRSGRAGQRANAPATYARDLPSWRLREATGTARTASLGGDLAGHYSLLVTRLGSRPTAIRAGTAAWPTSSHPVMVPKHSTAVYRNGGAGGDAAARRIASGAPAIAASLHLAERPYGPTAMSTSPGSRPGQRSDGQGRRAGVTAPWPLRREAGADKAAYIAEDPSVRPSLLVDRPATVRAGATAWRAASGPVTFWNRFAAAGLSGRGRIGAPAGRSVRPGAADRLSTGNVGPAPPAITAPLYLTQGRGGRTAASIPWAPPPLEFRYAVPPPVSPPQAEAQPAATPVRPPAAVDLEAVSRDVMSRIEKRLRIERERHGRS